LDSFEKSEDFIKLEQKLQMIFQKSNSNRSFKSYQAILQVLQNDGRSKLEVSSSESIENAIAKAIDEVMQEHAGEITRRFLLNLCSK
jgi:hypothetical protein